MPVSGTDILNLFSPVYAQQGQLINLAQSALSRGADLYMNGDFDGAIKEFKRAIGLDSSPDNVVKAENLIATVYLRQDKPDDAIKAYKTSLDLSPANDETHINLGNIYFDQGNYGDAEKEYKSAVRINPFSSTNVYSLGQAYLATGRYQEAESQFKQVISLDRDHYSGYYALGQTYSKEGQYEDAVNEFVKVIDMKKDFYAAYVDLGSAYADLGQMDEAREQLELLQENDSDLASLLEEYINQATPPKFLAAYTTNGFVDTLGPGTLLTTLDASLASPNTSKAFNIVFVFNKEMDAHEVQDPFNWSITRAPVDSPGGAYNWGMSVPETEAVLSPIPLAIVYEPDSASATVTFVINQNDTARGTIDPSHIMFKFFGTDAYGKTMDPAADQYSGLSKIV